MTKTMSIPDFVRNGWQEETTIQKFFAHLDRNKIKYCVIGTAIILFLSVSGLAFANGNDAVSVFASSGTGIDAGAKTLYKKLISVGKWIIIIKGGIETIKSAAVDGDFQNSRTKILGYVITYALLWALPWAFDEVEKLFNEMEGA